MDEILSFFRTYEPWIYVLLGVGAVYYLRKFISSWRRLRGAVFGLERENAQARLNQSASALILLIILAVAEFIIVSFVVPLYPQASPIMTPTAALFTTQTLPTEDLPVGEGDENGAVISPADTPEPLVNNCVPGQIDITSPRDGEFLEESVEIDGSATIVNFGFYKLEYGIPGTNQWQPIQAGRVPVVDGVLVQKWDTTSLDNLEYRLRLVVTDNVGSIWPPCEITIRVNNP